MTFPRELFHYTGDAGLMGILTTQTIRSTHISFLNDSQEHIGYFNTRLPEILYQLADKYVESLGDCPTYPFLNGYVVKEGASDSIVKNIREDLLARNTDRLITFVTSFCTADDPAVRKHGLLSQWRGYGANGGYALVFDAEELQTMVRQLQSRFALAVSSLHKVLYAQRTREVALPIEGLETCWEDVFNHYTNSASPADEEATFRAINALPAIYKHWGFDEEREWRFVLCLPAPKYKDFMPDTTQGLPLLPIENFHRDGIDVPYVTLFGKEHWKLPVKRIIVGPHPFQSQKVKSLDLKLQQMGLDIPVHASGIPFRGR